MESMREYWAREAATMRDKSALLDTRNDILGKSSLLAPTKKAVIQENFKDEEIVVWLNQPLNIGSLKLPKGLKVVQLGFETKDSDLVKCIFWWNKNYHEFWIKRAFLSKNLPIFDAQDILPTFQNDLEHVVQRVQGKIKIDTTFDATVRYVKNMIYNVKNVNSTSAYKLTKLTSTDSYTKSVDNYVKAIQAVYDPHTNDGGCFFDVVKVVPLTRAWYEKDTFLKKRIADYEKIDVFNFFRMEYCSGIALCENKVGLNAFKSELIVIADYLKKSENANTANTPEGRWILDLTSAIINPSQSDLIEGRKLKLDKILGFAFVDSGIWQYPLSQRYADYIALCQSFGCFQLHPVISVIIHELSQNGLNHLGYFKGKLANSVRMNNMHLDGHIGLYVSIETRKNIIENKLTLEDLQKSPNFDSIIDHLYQSNGVHSLLSAAIILNQLSK